jgi:hypothetical protein
MTMRSRPRTSASAATSGTASQFSSVVIATHEV